MAGWNARICVLSATVAARSTVPSTAPLTAWSPLRLHAEGKPDLTDSDDIDLETQAVPEQTRMVTRGVGRLFGQMGLASLNELSLKTGRRVDVMGISDKGIIHIAEVKVTVSDFRGDDKWQEYRDFCDYFYFAVPPTFPQEILPMSDDCGVIVADPYGGEVLRPAPHQPLAAARRKAVTLRFARKASQRLRHFIDPRL